MHQTGGQARLVVQSWRDLGSGRNPFERAWRSHGVAAEGMGMGEAQMSLLGLAVAGGRVGGVRESWERAGDDERMNDAKIESEVTAKSSSRLYRFSRSQRSVEADDYEVRRSSARPRYWRTREENEEVYRKREEERLDMQRNLAEQLARLDAIRGSGILIRSPSGA